MIAALIVAAGRGTRAASDASAPKQYVMLRGQPILTRTLMPFLSCPAVDVVQVVIHPDDEALYDQARPANAAKLHQPCHGGPTRQASVLCGLKALADLKPSIVLIHDAARPFIDSATIEAVIAAARQTGGAIAALPVSDTLKRAASDAQQPTIAETVDRARMWRALTPQAFDFAKIHAAHLAAEAAGRQDFTDDAAIAEAAGLPVALVEGQSTNIKITTPGDFAVAVSILQQSAIPDIRTGQGFDVHSFTPGEHVTLCGIDIPHSHRLTGHSDADVAMHALTDALYGAIADGDIGHHFPPSDDQWRGASSDIFLKHAADRVAAAGGTITNVDITIICEAPKIGPHRDAMRARLAQIIGLDVNRIAVKATTSERLGFTGRREGIAAMATATVVMTSLRGNA